MNLIFSQFILNILNCCITQKLHNFASFFYIPVLCLSDLLSSPYEWWIEFFIATIIRCLTSICWNKSLGHPDGGSARVPAQSHVAGVSDHYYGVGSIVNYSCEPGKLLFGKRERKCLTNGEWSGDIPVCSKHH